MMKVLKQTSSASWQDQDDGEVDISKATFVELVQMLLGDKYEKDKFLKVSSPSDFFWFVSICIEAVWVC